MAENRHNLSFPDASVPDSKKDEEYHQKYVEAICNSSFDTNYQLEYGLLNQLSNYYNGHYTGKEYEFMQEAAPGAALPAKWINFNRIKVKVDTLVSEYMERNWRINVEALDKFSINKKTEAKKDAYMDMVLEKKVRQPLEEQNGIPLPRPDFVPESKDHLDYYFSHTYKETFERVIEDSLRLVRSSTRMNDRLNQAFRDLVIYGRSVITSDIKGVMPTPRRVDPRCFLYDRNATDDFLSDSSFFGEARYMSLADCASEYGMSKSELLEAQKNVNKHMKSGSPLGQKLTQMLEGSTLGFFDQDGGSSRVLVLDACWLDYKTQSYKESKDKYGNIHMKLVKPKSSKATKHVDGIKIWRRGTLIGGVILKNWGEIENMPRGTKFKETIAPYQCVFPNYIDGRTVSKVEQLQSLQDFKDLTMYNIQLAMSRAGAKGFIYDIAQLPLGWDVESVIHYLKTAGIAFINSADGEGYGSSFNQFQQIDQTISQSVQQYINISMMIDREMDIISGINDARQGNIQNSSQAVGVTQSAIQRSSMTTEYMFNMFDSFTDRVLTHLAALAKISFGDESFREMLGDVAVDFIDQNRDIWLHDAGVFVKKAPEVVQNREMFVQMVMAALNSKQLGYAEAMKLMLSEDIEAAIRDLEYKEEEWSIKQQEREQAMQESQEAAMQQQHQNEMEKIQAEGEIDKQEEIIRGRIKMFDKKL